MDYYKTLGVNRNASPDEIKKAYRRLAGQHHPDKGGDTATFQKIQQAYETLSDPEKKNQYDNPNPFGGGMPGGGFHHGFPGGFQFNSTFDINDIVGQMFGGGSRHVFQQQYRTTIWVSLEQVYHGGEQILQMQGPNGSNTIKIDIPKGVENGAQLRYDNLITNGILLIEFRVHPHKLYDRVGQHLQSAKRISVLDLIIGTDFEFTTISGKTFTVQVKPGTQPDSTLRISGQGLPYMNEQGNGDQLILIKPYIPDKIDKQITDSILRSRSQ
jgi:DnaJ-class molecular chaperone